MLLLRNRQSGAWFWASDVIVDAMLASPRGMAPLADAALAVRLDTTTSGEPCASYYGWRVVAGVDGPRLETFVHGQGWWRTDSPRVFAPELARALRFALGIADAPAEDDLDLDVESGPWGVCATVSA